MRFDEILRFVAGERFFLIGQSAEDFQAEAIEGCAVGVFVFLAHDFGDLIEVFHDGFGGVVLESFTSEFLVFGSENQTVEFVNGVGIRFG